MDSAQITEYLRENGYPEHVVNAGRAGLIARYRVFVKQVERGYSLTLDDYRNELDLRGIIALIGADADVAEVDARLERLLIARDKRVWESGPGDPFWDFGYPGNAGKDLVDDLRAEGLTV